MLSYSVVQALLFTILYRALRTRNIQQSCTAERTLRISTCILLVIEPPLCSGVCFIRSFASVVVWNVYT
jgi:hypothetical protein